MREKFVCEYEQEFVIPSHERLTKVGIDQDVRAMIERRVKTFFPEATILDATPKGPPASNCIRVVLSPLDPFFDEEELFRHLDICIKNELYHVVPDGLVGGTAYVAILNGRASIDDDTRVLRSSRQREFNQQLNLGKYKRVKQFLALIETNPQVVELPILKVFELLEGVYREQVLSYSSGVELSEHSDCPSCGSDLQELENDCSQPMCGYIGKSSFYFECVRCGLIVLNPYPTDKKLSNLYDKWDYLDFETSLNQVYGMNFPRCKESVRLIEENGFKSVLDIGGGTGGFAKFIKDRFQDINVQYSDFDFKADDLDSSGVKKIKLALPEESIPENFDLITAWEVVEHFSYQGFIKLLKNVSSSLNPGGEFVFSTPDFDSPICRMTNFFSACPPFHLLVFRRSWLEKHLPEMFPELSLEGVQYCSDLGKDLMGWSGYLKKFGSSLQWRSLAEFFEHMGQKYDENVRDGFHSSMGSEVLVRLRKRG